MDAEAELRRLNRERVAAKSNIEGYQVIESWLMSHPFGSPLPPWITTGVIPELSKEELKEITLNSGYAIIDYE